MDRFFCFYRTKPIQKDVFPFIHIESFRAAGCLFTDEHTVLAGFQPTKKKPFLSGFGGNRNHVLKERYWETAFRETIEELFHCQPSPALLFDIENTLQVKKVLSDKTYVNIILDYKQLEQILEICRKHKILSPHYKKIPRTLGELLTMERKQIAGSEISHICLLPFLSEVVVDARYKDDISNLVALTQKKLYDRDGSPAPREFRPSG